MSHPQAKTYPSGATFRTHELRPLEGEARRWVVIRDGRPYAIKRTVRTFFETAMYRGFGMSSTDTVFVWRGWGAQS